MRILFDSFLHHILTTCIYTLCVHQDFDAIYIYPSNALIAVHGLNIDFDLIGHKLMTL